MDYGVTTWRAITTDSQCVADDAAVDRSGALHPEVGHVLPLEQAGDAHRLMLQRANYGKIVLEVGRSS